MTRASSISPRTPPAGPIPPDTLFGTTAAMERVRAVVERVSSVRIPILIRGESGTGKEALAHYLHGISPWRDQPFVKVNCAAIPGSLLESELFGYEKGSFTGATASRPGKFEQADRGTLLLDEIGEIDSGLQAKLLHALQDGCFTRIGDLTERRADVHVVSITNRNIQEGIAEGKFREDLYYRINVVDIDLPPLRQRIEDLPVLIDYFLRIYSAEFARPLSPLPREAVEIFRAHSWPGNIRELENYIKRFVILGSVDGILGEVREKGQVPQRDELVLQRPADFSLKKYAKAAAQQAEKFLMLEALKETQWNRRRAARLLGISYRAFLYKMQDAGLPSKRKNRPQPEAESVVHEAARAAHAPD